MENEIDPTEETGRHLSRRTVIKGVSIGTAAIWVAPAVTSLGTKAFAASSTNPQPQCAGETCATFTTCSDQNPDCVCTSSAQGGGFCIPGSTSCASLDPCDANNNCPSGAVCIVNTCCGDPVCAPDSLTSQCPPSTSTSAKKPHAFPAGSIGAA